MIRRPLTRRAKRRKLIRFIKNAMAYKIQKAIRNYLIRMINKDEASMKNEGDYRNSTTLIGTKLDDVDKRYFYKNKRYFFDIRELETLDRHPYTNEQFSESDKRQIRRILYYLKTTYYQYREINDEEEISIDNKISGLRTSVINIIERYGSYVSMNVLKNYLSTDLFLYIKRIFSYTIMSNTLGEEYTNINFRIYIHYVRYIKAINLELEESYCKELKNKFEYLVYKTLYDILNINDDLRESRALLLSHL